MSRVISEVSDNDRDDGIKKFYEKLMKTEEEIRNIRRQSKTLSIKSTEFNYDESPYRAKRSLKFFQRPRALHKKFEQHEQDKYVTDDAKYISRLSSDKDKDIIATGVKDNSAELIAKNLNDDLSRLNAYPNIYTTHTPSAEFRRGTAKINNRFSKDTERNILNTNVKRDIKNNAEKEPSSFVIEKNKIVVSFKNNPNLDISKATHNAKMYAKCPHAPKAPTTSHEKEENHPFFKNSQRLDKLLDQFLNRDFPQVDLLSPSLRVNSLFKEVGEELRSTTCKHISSIDPKIEEVDNLKVSNVNANVGETRTSRNENKENIREEYANGSMVNNVTPTNTIQENISFDSLSDRLNDVNYVYSDNNERKDNESEERSEETLVKRKNYEDIGGYNDDLEDDGSIYDNNDSSSPSSTYDAMTREGEMTEKVSSSEYPSTDSTDNIESNFTNLDFSYSNRKLMQSDMEEVEDMNSVLYSIQNENMESRKKRENNLSNPSNSENKNLNIMSKDTDEEDLQDIQDMNVGEYVPSFDESEIYNNVMHNEIAEEGSDKKPPRLVIDNLGQVSEQKIRQTILEKISNGKSDKNNIDIKLFPNNFTSTDKVNSGYRNNERKKKEFNVAVTRMYDLSDHGMDDNKDSIEKIFEANNRIGKLSQDYSDYGVLDEKKNNIYEDKKKNPQEAEGHRKTRRSSDYQIDSSIGDRFYKRKVTASTKSPFVQSKDEGKVVPETTPETISKLSSMLRKHFQFALHKTEPKQNSHDPRVTLQGRITATSHEPIDLGVGGIMNDLRWKRDNEPNVKLYKNNDTKLEKFQIIEFEIMKKLEQNKIKEASLTTESRYNSDKSSDNQVNIDNITENIFRKRSLLSVDDTSKNDEKKTSNVDAKDKAILYNPPYCGSDKLNNIEYCDKNNNIVTYLSNINNSTKDIIYKNTEINSDSHYKVHNDESSTHNKNIRNTIRGKVSDTKFNINASEASNNDTKNEELKEKAIVKRSLPYNTMTDANYDFVKEEDGRSQNYKSNRNIKLTDVSDKTEKILFDPKTLGKLDDKLTWISHKWNSMTDILKQPAITIETPSDSKPKKNPEAKAKSVKREDAAADREGIFSKVINVFRTSRSKETSGEAGVKSDIFAKYVAALKDALAEESGNTANPRSLEFLRRGLNDLCDRAVQAVQDANRLDVRETVDRKSEQSSQLMQQLVRLMGELVDYQVQQKTCHKLPRDLQKFVEWLEDPLSRGPPPPSAGDESHQSVSERRPAAGGGEDDEDDVLMTEAINDRNTERGEEDRMVAEGAKSRAAAGCLGAGCLGAIQRVEDLLLEYDALSEVDKSKMTGVRSYLSNQLDYLNQLAGSRQLVHAGLPASLDASGPNTFLRYKRKADSTRDSSDRNNKEYKIQKHKSKYIRITRRRDGTKKRRHRRSNRLLKSFANKITKATPRSGMNFTQTTTSKCLFKKSFNKDVKTSFENKVSKYQNDKVIFDNRHNRDDRSLKTTDRGNTIIRNEIDSEPKKQFAKENITKREGSVNVTKMTNVGLEVPNVLKLVRR